MNRRMHALALRVGLEVRACRSRGSPSPSRLNDPARRNSRRASREAAKKSEQSVERAVIGVWCRESRLHNLPNYLPVDLGQPFLSAKVQVAQLVLVEAELVQDRRVDIAEVAAVSYRP